jgi:tetratricopeptide (TPR) repeat protein
MSRADADVLEQRARQVREILARDPDDATLWFTLGRTLLELGRPDQAQEPLRRAIGIDPGYTAALRDLGRSLLEAGEAEEAESVLDGGREVAERTGDLQTGREIESFLLRARRTLGRESGPRQRKPRGREAPLSAASTSREVAAEARGVYREGFQHFANDRFAEAIALFERAIEVDPELAIAWNGLSLAHRQRGALDEAIEAGRRLIELEPDDALSHTNLSILYQRKGMIAEAEEEKAIAMQLLMRAQRGGAP